MSLNFCRVIRRARPFPPFPPLQAAAALLALGLALGLPAQAQQAAAAAAMPATPAPALPAPAGVAANAWANASCVAALELQSEALAGRVKAGGPEQAALTGLLRERLRAGAAFIGQAYLDGERDEQRSRQVLQQARQAQQSLPAAELAAQQERCAAQGSALLAQANMFARAMASRAAERRMKKLLESS